MRRGRPADGRAISGWQEPSHENRFARRKAREEKAARDGGMKERKSGYR